MLKTTTRFFVRLADRWMPDPLVVAIFLTFICLAAAVSFTDFGLGDSVVAWGTSFWNLLAFTMQMVLILGLGHVLAHTRPVYRALVYSAERINSAPMAYGGLAFIAACVDRTCGVVAHYCRELPGARNHGALPFAGRRRLAGCQRKHAGFICVHSAHDQYAGTLSGKPDRAHRVVRDNIFALQPDHIDD